MASFLDNLISQTSIPALEQLMQFTAARHDVLVSNIANIDTPGYQAQDLSVADFQQALTKALKDGASRPVLGSGQAGVFGPGNSSLVLRGRQVRTDAAGRLVANPEPAEKFNVTFHDRGNRSVEKEMSALAENTLAYNIAAELLRNQFATLKMAIRQKL
jgi:flagellar basal-body rod protein FlgB